jgi:hypothetical protein
VTAFSSPESILDFVRTFEFPYYLGSIFPSEMALYLLRCEQANIGSIIESGRGEGYSTAVIAAYGEAKGIPVVTVDWETNPELAIRCRQRLARFQSLEVIQGDMFDEMPGLLDHADGQVALLIDGPKYSEAIFLSAAATALGSVRVVAHHNTEPGVPWHSHFIARFPEAGRFEDSEFPNCTNFHKFREWEFAVTEGTPARSIENTSLMVTVLPSPGPTRVYLRGPSLFHTLGATSLYWAWKLNIRVGSMVAQMRRLMALSAGS